MALHCAMRYDLAVIGGGSAGLAAAKFAARMGATVVLVEAERIGGDCTWTGCVPSKALIHAARVSHQARASGWLGAQSVDFAAVARHVHEAVGCVYAFETPDSLRAEGVEVVLGRARFVGTRTIEAAGRRLEARRFVVCTGAEPVVPSIPGLHEAPHLTYLTVFELNELPDRLLVLGGGPTGVELAQAFGRLGSEVTVFDQLDRLLAIADPEASAVVEACFRREGVEVVLGAEVARVETGPAGVSVVAGGRSHHGDALLVAVGRRPRVAELDLEVIGVRVAKHGIEVDAALRTSQRHVYAAGDVTGGPQFTHYAVWQGYAAARNALFPGQVDGVKRAVPWAVFTDPEVAQVGLGEAEARAGGHLVSVHRLPVERIDRAQAEGETDGFLKLVTAGGDRLLGATIVSAGAADLANAIVIALDAGGGLSQLARVIPVYPTRGYGMLQLASVVRLERAASSRRVRVLSRLLGRR
ncbi:MAG TPA: FAD-dependent oxidoreductase [Candidatus Dormibacteraeota bacterium]|nr:FAD-dependent oxidoreductase [Candidatus Dormibacteraeota bacterium]